MPSLIGTLARWVPVNVVAQNKPLLSKRVFVRLKMVFQLQRSIIRK